MPNLVPVSWRRSMEDLRENVMSVFDRWLPHKEAEAEEAPFPAAWFSAGYPAVDVEDDDDCVRVTAELPGVDEKDLDVRVEGHRCLITGEKRTSHEARKKNHYYAECSYGAFRRAVPLPCEVDTEQAKATYKRGVLKLTLPKTDAAKRQRVHIDVA